MGRYFKITDKLRHNRITVIDAPAGSQLLFAEIESICGMTPSPANDIPHALEADGWGEMAWIGQIYEADEFEIECIDEEEYKDWMIYSCGYSCL